MQHHDVLPTYLFILLFGKLYFVVLTSSSFLFELGIQLVVKYVTVPHLRNSPPGGKGSQIVTNWDPGLLTVNKGSKMVE